jgi:methoxymalonate biosynthesis acyl carrier protein
MDTNDIHTSVKQFIIQRIKKEDLQDNEDYFSLGIVNSLFAMQLVLFVEKEFQIAVEDQDLKLDNFRTIRALTDFVGRKLASG